MTVTALSMDSRSGSILYKFDMSLMERLSTFGLAMSTINVQRRMQPTISSLIRFVQWFYILNYSSFRVILFDRNTLYPNLEDHPLVKKYPDVRGLQHNVFFLTHTHKENDGSDDTSSKFNTYEVRF